MGLASVPCTGSLESNGKGSTMSDELTAYERGVHARRAEAAERAALVREAYLGAIGELRLAQVSLRDLANRVSPSSPEGDEATAIVRQLDRLARKLQAKADGAGDA